MLDLTDPTIEIIVDLLEHEAGLLEFEDDAERRRAVNYALNEVRVKAGVDGPALMN